MIPAVPVIWRRHDLVRVGECGWNALLRGDPGLGALDGVGLWIARDWPAMLRRRLPDDAPGMLPLALALPSAFGRLRLAIRLPAALVEGPAAPVTLAALLEDATLPAHWHQRIESVLEAADALGLSPTPFGSLLWQHVTGLPYLRDGSDLDLCWWLSPNEVGRVDTLLATLRRLDAMPGPRLDGEIGIAGRGAVGWRELAGERDELLAKTETEVILMPRARFLLPEPASC